MIAKKNNISGALLFMLFLILAALSGNSQSVILQGTAEEYAGEEIRFYTYSDFISSQKEVLDSAIVSQNGEFRCAFPLEETRKIYSELGVYEAYLYVKPGTHYTISLPPRQEKTQAQQLNPYFEGIPYHIGVENSKEPALNPAMYRFKKHYDRVFNENALRLKNPAFNKDSIIQLIEHFNGIDHPFYQTYRKYRTEGLRLTLKNGSGKLKASLFNDSSIYYHNPAYAELFNEMFREYFNELPSRFDIVITPTLKQYKDPAKIDSLLAHDTLLTQNPRLRELVQLKALHDAFYSPDYPQKDIISVLDSFARWSDYPEHQKISRRIRQKVARLLVGYEPPGFCLYDVDSNKVCLDDYKGEYVYLGFCNSRNYTCLKHYNILRNVYKQHKNHFRIVIISTEETFSQLKHFLDRKDYKWTFLYGGADKQILEKYDIKTMPSYFFIKKDGTLGLSPAPAPSEKIEWRIYQILKANGDI